MVVLFIIRGSILLFLLATSKCDVLNIRIGVLFDGHTEQVANLFQQSFTKYVQDYYDDIEVEVVYFNMHHVKNITAEVTEDKRLACLILTAEDADCSQLNTLKHLLPLYVISGSSENCNVEDGTNGIFYLYPPANKIISAILKVTREYAWTKAIVLERVSEEIHLTFASMQLLRDSGLDIVAFEAPSDPLLLKEILKSSRTEGIRAYILACPVSDVLEILEMANELELLTDNYHWLVPNALVYPDAVGEFMQQGVRVSFLYSPFTTPVVKELSSFYNKSNPEIRNDVIVALGQHVLQLTVDACKEAKTNFCLTRNLETNKYDCYIDVTSSVMPTIKEDHNITKRSIDEEVISETATTPRAISTRLGIVKRSKTDKRSILCGYIDPNFAIARDDLQQSMLRQRRSASNTTAQYNKCLVEHFNPRIFSFTNEAIGKMEDIDRPRHKRSFKNKRSTENFIIRSTIDTCNFENIALWYYLDTDCNYGLLENMNLKLANFIMFIEYVANGNDIFNPIISGIYKTDGIFKMNVNYKQLLTYDISLPKRTMRVGAIYMPPWFSWRKSFTSNKTIVEGFLNDMLVEMSAQMNFTYEFVFDSYFGSENRSHTRDEIEDRMSEMFMDNKCDFFLYAQLINGGRLMKSNRVDISVPYQTPSMYLLTKRIEKADSIDIWQFMLPFQQISWVVFWSTFIIISLLLAYINARNPNEYQAISTDFGPNSDPGDHLGVMNSLWFNYAAIAQQGAAIAPRSMAGKCLTATWWAFVLLVLSAYTANMTAFMTQVNQGTIETLEELANQQEVKYGIVRDNAMLRYLLPSAKRKPYTTIYSYLKKNIDAQFATNDDALEKVLSGNFYVISSYEMAVEAMSDSCQYDVSGNGFYQHNFGLPFAKGSVFTPLFGDYIKKLRDSGVFMELESKWFDLEAECEDSASGSGTSEGQLDLQAFIGMYVFLIIGITIGLIICLIETGWIKCGGLGGFFGKAKMYEIETDKRESIKKNEMLEEEFKSWEGGWEVWKFKEWNANIAPPSDQTPNCVQWCHICGRPAPEHTQSDVIKGQQEIILRDRTLNSDKCHHEEPLAAHQGGSSASDDGSNSKYSETVKHETTDDSNQGGNDFSTPKEESIDAKDEDTHNPGRMSSASTSSRRYLLADMQSQSSFESQSIYLPPSSNFSTPTTARRANSIYSIDSLPAEKSSTTRVVSNTSSSKYRPASSRHRRMLSGSNTPQSTSRDHSANL